ncbi:MAG: hypothetical protein ACREPR_10090 [Brasilonema sp.]
MSKTECSEATILVRALALQFYWNSRGDEKCKRCSSVCAIAKRCCFAADRPALVINYSALQQ